MITKEELIELIDKYSMETILSSLQLDRMYDGMNDDSLSNLSKKQLDYAFHLYETTYIHNCSMDYALSGDIGLNIKDTPTVLIQIQDPNTQFIDARYFEDFVNIYRFHFTDAESGENIISDEQAETIARILQNCYKHSFHVIVHCHAGICRSGAITKAASLIGFKPLMAGSDANANTLVYNKVRKALGVSYSWENSNE